MYTTLLSRKRTKESPAVLRKERKREREKRERERERKKETGNRGRRRREAMSQARLVQDDVQLMDIQDIHWIYTVAQLMRSRR